MKSGRSDLSKEPSQFNDQILESFSPSILAAVIRRHKVIAAASIAGALFGFLLSFVLPKTFTASARLMPPDPISSLANGISGATGMSAQALGLKDPSDPVIAVLTSRSVADGVIEKFSLDQVYHSKYRSKTREILGDQVRVISSKDGTIEISVSDDDAKRAAAMVQTFIDELFKSNDRIAVTEAGQRRQFLSRELEQLKNKLADSEADLQKTQEKTGVVQLEGQTRVSIESSAKLRGQLSAKEVELQTLRAFVTDSNADYVRVQKEIAALRAQIADASQNDQDNEGVVALRKIPGAGAEYVRKLREVKYNEALFQLVAKQYETARMAEDAGGISVQIIDSPIVPDRPSWPKKRVISFAFLMVGFLGSVLFVLWQHVLSTRPEIAALLSEYRRSFRSAY
jgi:uncharacterized protein involved in exopolysaccharide biosynthesis